MMAARAWVLASVLLLAACAEDDPAGTVSGTGTGTGTGTGGAGGAAPSCEPAAGPFGNDPTAGESLPDLSLLDCSGTELDLGAHRCEATLTWISVGAGWCAPCQEETPDLEAASVAYEGMGVQFVQVMFEDAGNNPATTQFCGTWVSTYDLTFPVLIDPGQDLLEVLEDGTPPINLLLDHDGKVLWTLNGVPDDIGAVIDEHL